LVGADGVEPPTYSV